MSYVTAATMIQKFGEQEIIELTDNEEPYQYAINHEKLNAALEEANSEIDGFIQGRYPQPLQVIPPFLRNIGCHLARYHLCTKALTDTDPIKVRYDNAVGRLKSISKGEMGLGSSPAGESAPTESSSNNVIFGVGRRDFGGSKW